MEDKVDNSQISHEFQNKLIQRNLLSKTPTAANEDFLVGKVTSKESSAAIEDWRVFFLMDYSRPFLSWISAAIYKSNWMEIQGQYYIFISANGGDDDTPYYKVGQFSRKRDASLRRYLSFITLRHIWADKRKGKGPKGENLVSIDEATRVYVNFSGDEEIENPWYALLIYDGETDQLSANDLKLLERLKAAIAKLPKNEQVVIQGGTYDELQGDEIYDELLKLGLVNPNRDIATLTAKDKQNAVANIRKRAIKHLKKLMEQ